MISFLTTQEIYALFPTDRNKRWVCVTELQEIYEIIELYRDSEHPINEILDAMKDNIQELIGSVDSQEFGSLDICKSQSSPVVSTPNVGKSETMMGSTREFSETATNAKQEEEISCDTANTTKQNNSSTDEESSASMRSRPDVHEASCFSGKRELPETREPSGSQVAHNQKDVMDCPYCNAIIGHTFDCPIYIAIKKRGVGLK